MQRPTSIHLTGLLQGN